MTDETPDPEQSIEAEVVPPTISEPAFVSNVAEAAPITETCKEGKFCTDDSCKEHRLQSVPAPSRMLSKLSTLPPEIVEEINTRLKGSESLKFIREDMIKKYPSVEQLKVGYLTWRKYAAKIRGGTATELKDGTVVKKEMVAALPTAEDLQKAVSTVLDPSISLDRKQEALSSLFNKATQRLAVLEARQKNWLDPEIEALMLAYMKEQKSLIEKVTELQEVLNKDVITQFRSELNEYTRTILSTVYQSYNLTHPTTSQTNAFDQFRVTLEGLLTKVLQTYSSNSQSK